MTTEPTAAESQEAPPQADPKPAEAPQAATPEKRLSKAEQRAERAAQLEREREEEMQAERLATMKEIRDVLTRRGFLLVPVPVLLPKNGGDFTVSARADIEPDPKFWR